MWNLFGSFTKPFNCILYFKYKIHVSNLTVIISECYQAVKSNHVFLLIHATELIRINYPVNPVNYHSGINFAIIKICQVLFENQIFLQHDAKDVKFLCRPGSPIILVFWPRRWYPIARENPSAWRKIQGCGKILRFSTEIVIYLGNGMRGPRLLWNVNRKSYVLYWNGDIFNDLDGPLTWFSRSQHF